MHISVYGDYGLNIKKKGGGVVKVSLLSGGTL